MDEPTSGRKRITDVRVLAALAHPVRLGLLHYLLAAGPRTATACADVVDASPSACSYHLRHLERFGLVERVEPAPGERVDGRTRRWRAAAAGFSLGTTTPSQDPPEMRAARQALFASGLAENLRLAQQYLDRSDELPAAWQDAGEFSTYGLLVSPGELRDVLARIDAILRPLRAPVREDAPADARVVRVVLDAFARVDLDPADRRAE